MRRLLYAILLPLLGCSPSSMEDYRHEGQSWSRSLILELQQIHTTEELLQSEHKLKKKFDESVSLMIAAREYQQKHWEDALEEPSDSALTESLNQELQAQLRRIYDLEGGRECIERAQQEALVRLDAHERHLMKKKELQR